ncbi:MAG: thioredoxin domain-containing protein [Deltaproteobacteria bacterium]|nr:thioredoxin domain-containing protein [Deltaproteobacteria bacterium]
MIRNSTTEPSKRSPRERRVTSLAAAATVVLASLAAISAQAAEPSAAQLARVPELLPSAPPLPAAVRVRIASELASRPSDYAPRTRHLRPDGSPEYSNRLLLEARHYLQQHAHNPVNWYPWGDEAFADAKRLGRPVLVSIGYATCHWCHVMEEESFDSVAAASYLNEHFISIKVDREIRPDIDAVYMAALSAMGKEGGWPLNVWLTPEREPFFAGTYFPPRSVGERPGFLDVLREINETYTDDRERVTALSKQIVGSIRQQLAGESARQTRVPDRSVFDLALATTARAADRRWGGSRGETKFPSSFPLRFLLRHYRLTGEKDALTLATLTLEKMAEGGIRDHIGGGFHRYATDNRWLVPHFEKMLYDNALLAVIYLEAAQLTGREDFAAVSRSILDYVMREMTSPEGAFYSATDADSLSDSGESEEGWFFTWTPAEIESALGADLAKIATAYYGVTPRGDYEGRNILHTWRSRETVAAELGMSVPALDAALERVRSGLYEARSRRSPPLRDSKVLVSWNGLMIGAFARAGLVFDEERYVEAAARAAAFILDEMQLDGVLRRVHQGGRAEGPAFLEDYAFLIAGLIDLYEVDTQPRWLRAAIALQSTLDSRYIDELGGGYFQTADNADALLAREKPSRDGAIPSGNSVAALNLLRLGELTGDHQYADAVVWIFSAFSDLMESQPTAVSEMLLALDFYLSKRVEIVLIAPPDGKGLDEMLAPVRATFYPNRVLVSAVEDEQLESHAEINPLLEARIARGGETTVYLCQNYVCGFPTADPAVFAEQLSALASEKN